MSPVPDVLPTPTLMPAIDTQPVSGPPAGLVSVVVLCCGQLEYTRLCVTSVLRFSRPPFEVIAVDAGALDGTAEFWAGVQAATSTRVEIVRSPADVDLPVAFHEGVARCRGEFVVLLNNDTVVTSGWLNCLTALMSSGPNVGMVAPMTTFGPAAQVVWPVPYRLGAKATDPGTGDEIRTQIEAVNRFGREWGDKQRGKWAQVERLGGGCVMVRSTALQATQPLPGAPLQFYDPEALSGRVRETGFRLACCRDLFVHSFGSRGFAPLESRSGDRPG
jgi:GT2 family glycosyltransferase